MIHDAVAATLVEMGLCQAPVALLRTVLIGDGYFLGEKYRFDGGCALWLAQTNTIEVFDDEGQPLGTVSLAAKEEGTAA